MSRRDRVVAVLGTNFSAAAAGCLVALFVPVPLLARIPLSILAGTAGYFLGAWLSSASLGFFLRARLAQPGLRVYDLLRLPPCEAGPAGGKARSLAQLAQAGFRVPAAFVIQPRAFRDDGLTAAAHADVAAALGSLGEGPYAVRSSAQVEDAPGASFAGAFESVLDVSASQVEEAVLRVRRSGEADRVRAYAAARDIEAAPEVAVLVQRMVWPEMAGVLFTVHPLTGDLSTMVGNVVTGLGETLVAGSANADEFTFVRPAGTYTGPAELVPASAELHSLAHDIESTLGGFPQDIEWAISGGRVWILQSRPITTMRTWNPTTAERNDSLAGTCLWSANNLTEASPEPQTPLTVSLVAYQQDHGGPSMKLHGRELAGYIGGRPYANLSVQITARGPKAAVDPRGTYRRVAGLWGELPAVVPIPLLPLTKADWQQEGLKLLGTLLHLQRAKAGVPRFLATSRERCRALTQQVAASTSRADLLRLWSTELLPASLEPFWAVIASTGDQIDTLEPELRELVGIDEAALLLANISGLAGRLASLGPAVGLQEVAAGRLSRADYLEQFGHRGQNELELAWPRPAEDPAWLESALTTVHDTDTGLLRERQEALFTAALDRLRHNHPDRFASVQRRLRLRARTAARREEVRSEAVRWTGLTRRFAIRAGELLGIGEGVFLLTVPELLEALDGAIGPYQHFASRRTALERYRELPPLPAFIVGRFDPVEWAADPARPTDYFVAGVAAAPQTAAPDRVVRGAPGSLGVAEGRVRRLDRLEEADQLRPGEVLVTHLTNIGWTPLFPRAAALVTDLGAPLSHAAIVARELGIPAVVGCRDATIRLATGDLVLVDGARGTVEILEPAKRIEEFGDTLEHVFDSIVTPG